MYSFALRIIYFLFVLHYDRDLNMKAVTQPAPKGGEGIYIPYTFL